MKKKFFRINSNCNNNNNNNNYNKPSNKKNMLIILCGWFKVICKKWWFKRFTLNCKKNLLMTQGCKFGQENWAKITFKKGS